MWHNSFTGVVGHGKGLQPNVVAVGAYRQRDVVQHKLFAIRRAIV
ncbi:hypothetical protein [Sodalis-like endosymbiont of Proechinophthirus fluctus]|nr:hypothetical protein [Sodalis-like endosymbiont of Proechinophthirus fluctus]